MAREEDQARLDALLAAVGHSPDDELAAVSARARSRRHWLRQQAAESCTMTGVLLTLAEGDAAVTIRCGPWTHVGLLRRVSMPLCIVERADGIALVPTGSITTVEGPDAVADDRTPASGPDLAAVLAGLVSERPAVRLQLRDGTEVAGVLVDLGKDVATVRLTSSVATIRLSAVAGCILPTLGSAATAGSARDGFAQDDESGGDLGSADDFGSG